MFHLPNGLITMHPDNTVALYMKQSYIIYENELICCCSIHNELGCPETSCFSEYEYKHFSLGNCQY